MANLIRARTQLKELIKEIQATRLACKRFLFNFTRLSCEDEPEAGFFMNSETLEELSRTDVKDWMTELHAIRSSMSSCFCRVEHLYWHLGDLILTLAENLDKPLTEEEKREIEQSSERICCSLELNSRIDIF